MLRALFFYTFVCVKIKKKIMKKVAEYFDSIWHYSLQGKMAVCSFIMGCVIACICLFGLEPLGEIATSAISIVSMFLVLAGALVGVKVSFDSQANKFAAEMNKLEMKLGIITSESDTVNKFKASEDLLRLTSKLGIQAHKQWYYSVQLLANTQFMRGYKDNKKDVFSDFMSPFNLNISLGMDYYVDIWKKKLTGTIHLAPLAYNLKYTDRANLAKSFGIDKDHRALNDFGSQLTVELTWKPIDMLKWETKLYSYTTYHKFTADWENTISFNFNKFISAKLFLYPRFDDSVNRDNDFSYWQFHEYLSFGFSYSM